VLYHVGTKIVRVRRRNGMTFRLHNVPAGAAVRIAAGDAKDAYGNLNPQPVDLHP